MVENCCCCPANCGELRPGLLVLMPDAMGLPPGFIGLLALAMGFPRTCRQRERGEAAIEVGIGGGVEKE